MHVPLVDFGVHGGDRCSTPVHQTVTSTGSHLLYRLNRSCLAAMTSVEIRHPEAQVSLIKNHELCLRSHPSIQAHYITSTSSLHHLCKAICHLLFSEDSVPTSPLCHMSTRITTESLELTKQYLDTVVIQSHYTAHRILFQARIVCSAHWRGSTVATWFPGCHVSSCVCIMSMNIIIVGL